MIVVIFIFFRLYNLEKDVLLVDSYNILIFSQFVHIVEFFQLRLKNYIIWVFFRLDSLENDVLIVDSYNILFFFLAWKDMQKYRVQGSYNSDKFFLEYIL